MTTSRRTTNRTAARDLAARQTQSFDSTGQCEHITISFDFGTPHILWSVRDECLFCGTGQEWK